MVWCRVVSRILDFFFQAGDGIRGLVRDRGLGDVYKGQGWYPESPDVDGALI